MLPRTLLCLAVLSASAPLLADTVWLKNGDRLTGKIKVFDGGKLLIQTDYAGAIPVDWKQVKTLESDQELLVKQDAYTGEKAKSLKAADDGKVVLANGEAPKTVELASIQQIIKPKPVIEDLVWKGNVDMALDYRRAEKDTNDYDIDFKTIARHGQWRHTGQGEYNREFQDDVTTTDNWALEYDLDRFLTEHWFWQGRLTYKRDKVEDLSRQRTVGTGPGYQFWDDELGGFLAGVAGQPHRLRILRWRQGQLLFPGHEVELQPLSGRQDGRVLHQRRSRQAHRRPVRIFPRCGNGPALQSHRVGLAQPQG